MSKIPKPAIGGQSVDVSVFFDPKSTTCGLQAAIDALPAAGGQVRVPAGTYVLRDSIRLPDRVRLIGEGPATVLCIRPLRALALAKDVRQGARTLTFAKRVPVKAGDGIGVGDDRMRGWWGTHARVESADGHRVRLDRAINRGVSVGRGGRAVNLFPAIWAENAVDVEIADLMIRGFEGYAGRWWDFTYAAIHVVRCERVRISGCRVTGWPSDGIGVQRGADVLVTQCMAHGCRGHGYHPGTGLGNSVWSHNIGRNNGGDGLYFCMRVHHSVCSDSVFDGNGMNGIGGVANGFDHHDIISNNVCSNNALCGIDANRGEEQMMIGNLLLNNSKSEPGRWPGIRLHDMRRALVQGNRCADDQETPTQTRGIVESGESDGNLISGNMCTGMAEAVVAIGQNSRAEGNLV